MCVSVMAPVCRAVCVVARRQPVEEWASFPYCEALGKDLSFSGSAESVPIHTKCCQPIKHMGRHTQPDRIFLCSTQRSSTYSVA